MLTDNKLLTKKKHVYLRIQFKDITRIQRIFAPVWAVQQKYNVKKERKNMILEGTNNRYSPNKYVSK